LGRKSGGLAWRDGADFILHPLINTCPRFAQAQDLEKKKAEPKLRSIVGKCKALLRKMPQPFRVPIYDNMENMFVPT
jgi:hypothetical protein